MDYKNSKGPRKNLIVPRSPSRQKSEREVARLLNAIHDFYQKGWVPATGGNFSVLLSSSPFRLAITTSGIDKKALHKNQILTVDAGGRVIQGHGKASAETGIHLTLIQECGAKAIFHTHSVWGTTLSQIYASRGGFYLEGYEMLKALRGVKTHTHREWLPIIENSQDISLLSSKAREVLRQYPRSHGFLTRGHGLYTWGSDLTEAKRHVEALEFLLEVFGRTRSTRSRT